MQKLEDDLAQVDLKLNGDKIRAKHYFETKPSLSDRLNSAIWNSYSTSSAPTGEQRKNLRILNQERLPLETEIKRINKELDNFYSILLNSGAPYLDGEMDEDERIVWFISQDGDDIIINIKDNDVDVESYEKSIIVFINNNQFIVDGESTVNRKK